MKLEFNKLHLLPIAVVILIIGIYYAVAARSSPPADEGWQAFVSEPEAAAPEQIEQQTIMIYIAGEVVNPDVYELPLGSRIKDAVDAAGGMTEEAAAGFINLSARISDEQHIIIPKTGKEPPIAASSQNQNSQSQSPTSKLININTASSAELQQLTGIGPAMAGRIIDYREANGRFTSTRDIMKISGIGEKTYEALADSITVE